MSVDEPDRAQAIDPRKRLSNFVERSVEPLIIVPGRPSQSGGSAAAIGSNAMVSPPKAALFQRFKSSRRYAGNYWVDCGQTVSASGT